MARTISDDLVKTISETLVEIILEQLDYEHGLDESAEYAVKIGYHELLPAEPRGYRDEPDDENAACAYTDILGEETPHGCHVIHHETNEYAVYYNAYEYKECCNTVD